jgi:(p)ppGpp synthase/HD superfamily hydrolase
MRLPGNFVSVKAAINLAKKIHRSQFRRDGKTEYFVHLKRVAFLVKKAGGSEEQTIIAYLHDSVENSGDKNKLKNQIREKFGKEILNSVLLLTRPKDVSYREYFRKIKRNKKILLIKLCDMFDNLSDKPTEKQKKKYLLALLELFR